MSTLTSLKTTSLSCYCLATFEASPATLATLASSASVECFETLSSRRHAVLSHLLVPWPACKPAQRVEANPSRLEKRENEKESCDVPIESSQISEFAAFQPRSLCLFSRNTKLKGFFYNQIGQRLIIPFTNSKRRRND